MELRDEVVELTQQLIRIDTSNYGPGSGNETEAAEHLADYLAKNGIDAELVAREPGRANLVARLPGSADGPSLAFVGHLDVVPVDGQNWTRPPFEAVIENDWLYGRGAVDMKNEVAARAVAMAHLARTGFRPRGDLWLLMAADEENGTAEAGMPWLLRERPDINPTYSINEGGGDRFQLSDGRTMLGLGIGEKGVHAVRVTAMGEAGHASMPELGDNAVPKLAELIMRIGKGSATQEESPILAEALRLLVGDFDDRARALAKATELHPMLRQVLPPLAGTTMAPTMLYGSSARNVMPERASVDLDCRVLPGRETDQSLAAVRQRLGEGDYELEIFEPPLPGNASPATSALPTALAEILASDGDPAVPLPVLCAGYTDSSAIRATRDTEAYGFSLFRETPIEVLNAGYHNADERVHIADLEHTTRFHIALAEKLLA